MRQVFRWNRHAFHIVGHRKGNVCGRAREILECIERTNLKLRQAHSLLYRFSNGNNLPRARTNHCHALQVPTPQRKHSIFILEQDRRINRGLLHNLDVLAMVGGSDIEFVLAIQEAKPVHLQQDPARGARDRFFRDDPSCNQVLQIRRILRLAHGEM